MYKKNKEIKAGVSTSEWVLLLSIGIFLSYAPFNKALFNGHGVIFEGPIYNVFVLNSVLLLLIAFYFFGKNYDINLKKNQLGIVAFVIPISFSISSVNAASPYLASSYVWIQVLYASIFICGIILSSKELTNKILQSIILLTSYSVVIFGFFNWVAITNYQDAVLQNRLSSVFQYPNTYAGYLLALLFSTILIVLFYKKLFIRFIASFMLVPIFVSFILTLSRGALLTIPVIFVVVLLLLSWHRQILFILYFFITVLASLLISHKISTLGISLQTGSGGNPFIAFLILTVTSLIVSIVITLVQKYFDRNTQEHNLMINKKTLILPISSVFLMVLVLFLISSPTIQNLIPSNFHRITQINLTQTGLADRFSFYADAFKIVGDYPLFGTGGGGWAVLYDTYKEYPYVSRQAHNFFVQLLVEIGILGFCAYMFILIFTIYLCVKNTVTSKIVSDKLVYLIMAVTIIVHSALDFDMSYVYVGAFVFLCLGGAIGEVKERMVILPKVKNFKIYIASAVIILAIFTFVNAITLVNGHQYYTSSIDELNRTKNLNKITDNINKAISADSTNPAYLLLKSNILFQTYLSTKQESYLTEANTLVEQGKLFEPNDVRFIQQHISFLSSTGKWQEAIAMNDLLLKKYPWNLTAYENSMGLYYDYANVALQQNDLILASNSMESLLKNYEIFNDKLHEVETLPESMQHKENFDLTPKIALMVSQTYFNKGKYQESNDLIKFFVTSSLDDPLNRHIMRLHLASLAKLGKEDNNNYTILISKFPEEVSELEKLKNSKPI